MNGDGIASNVPKPVFHPAQNESILPSAASGKAASFDRAAFLIVAVTSAPQSCMHHGVRMHVMTRSRRLDREYRRPGRAISKEAGCNQDAVAIRHVVRRRRFPGIAMKLRARRTRNAVKQPRHHQRHCRLEPMARTHPSFGWCQPRPSPALRHIRQRAGDNGAETRSEDVLEEEVDAIAVARTGFDDILQAE